MTPKSARFACSASHWTNASSEVIRQAAKELLAGQHDDGGWAQTPGMTSDAYATGQALVALGESGSRDARRSRL